MMKYNASTFGPLRSQVAAARACNSQLVTRDTYRKQKGRHGSEPGKGAENAALAASTPARNGSTTPSD